MSQLIGLGRMQTQKLSQDFVFKMSDRTLFQPQEAQYRSRSDIERHTFLSTLTDMPVFRNRTNYCFPADTSLSFVHGVESRFRNIPNSRRHPDISARRISHVSIDLFISWTLSIPPKRASQHWIKCCMILHHHSLSSQHN
jgi:hypothetical protein